LKKLSPSIECFDKAIENNNAYAKAWYNKGRALSLLGKTDESQKSFDMARKLDPLLFTKLRRMK
jgi:tetratricopeptide (TPR) repeat protein